MVALTCGGGSQHATEFLLGHGSRQITLNSNGAVIAWPGNSKQAEDAQEAVAGEIRYGGRDLKLTHPQVSRTSGELSFSYQWPEEPGLEVKVRHQITKNQGAFLWTRDIQIRGEGSLTSDLTVSLQSWPSALPGETWLPLIDGTGATLATNDAAAFRFVGALPGNGALLALPMVSVPVSTAEAAGENVRKRALTPARRNPIPGQPSRVLIAADPYFSTLFKRATLEWTYPAKAGLENGHETRRIVIAVHQGSVGESIACYFRALLPDVAPGPGWLHEIAMVDFDYLSDGGQGWFRDLDALAAALPSRDRRQVFLCLHGWYDFLGRYCFDANTGKLDRDWISFSNYENARKVPALGTIGGEQVEVGFANCKPVKMSLADVHHRLRYARSRRFRAGLYFADGLNAGDGVADFNPARVLRWGGWQGPDSKGKSYIQNPLHPGVRAFYRDYAKALLAEFGPDIDALVWDETFHVPCGQLGTDAWPGYADRAMMRLVREIAALVEKYNRQHQRQIAFLTSDCLGAFSGGPMPGPYALVSHGTYQDSWCQPQAWSYGLFANYRNVLWSCCWWPVTKWSWIEFGVREYQAPVALSNGWGNDKGFSELTPDQQARALELFNWRKKNPTQLKWFVRLP